MPFRGSAWFKRLIAHRSIKETSSDATNSKVLVCQDVVELLSDYLEETLLPQMQEQVADHLAGCEGCTAYVNQLRQTIHMLRTLAEDPMPPSTREELLVVFQNWKRAQENL